MASKNPFRTHVQLPEAALAAPPRAVSPPLPPLPPSSPITIAASPSLQSAIPVPSEPAPYVTSTHTSAAPDMDLIDDDDLPPPYTPAPNLSIGEETLEIAPRRPFQQPPPSSSPYTPSASGSRPNWPSSAQPPQPQPTGSGSRVQPEPRPHWQTQQQYRQRPSAGGGGGLLGALFDTVRDIADVVSGAHDERLVDGRRTNAGVYASPYNSTGAGRGAYAALPGPPSQVQQPPTPRPSSTPPRSSPRMVPDDGTPTRTPVPGHPLLRDGNLLVYPRDYFCVKCKNTGYKNYDPSNPCRRCWEKYGNPYTGVLAYAPWSSSGNDPRMQRALPKFVPPHVAGLNPGSYSGYAPQPRYGAFPPPQHPQHARSISQPRSMYPQATGPTYYVVNPVFSFDATPPVPHAIPVSPGDPRLGGRLCVRCGGAGVGRVVFFDLTTCETCGGSGRIWT